MLYEVITIRWAVPTSLIWHCWLSSSRISRLNRRPLSIIASRSTTLLRFPFTPGILQTRAFIFLFRKTVPIPPLPACLSLTRITSYNVCYTKLLRSALLPTGQIYFSRRGTAIMCERSICERGSQENKCQRCGAPIPSSTERNNFV